MADSAAASVTVGWIGTGRMGKPLAERLARAGVPLAVWNRTRGKAEAITRTGAEVVDEPSDLAGRDVVFTMVTGSAELESVVSRLFADPGRARSFGLLAPFGRLVSYSNISAEPEVAPDAEWMRARCVGYLGFSGGQLSARAPELLRPAMEEAVGLVASGAVDLGVSAVFPVQEVADAHRVFEARAARGKLVLAL